MPSHRSRLVLVPLLALTGCIGSGAPERAEESSAEIKVCKVTDPPGTVCTVHPPPPPPTPANVLHQRQYPPETILGGGSAPLDQRFFVVSGHFAWCAPFIKPAVVFTDMTGKGVSVDGPCDVDLTGYASDGTQLVYFDAPSRSVTRLAEGTSCVVGIPELSSIGSTDAVAPLPLGPYVYWNDARGVRRATSDCRQPFADIVDPNLAHAVPRVTANENGLFATWLTADGVGAASTPFPTFTFTTPLPTGFLASDAVEAQYDGDRLAVLARSGATRSILRYASYPGAPVTALQVGRDAHGLAFDTSTGNAFYFADVCADLTTCIFKMDASTNKIEWFANGLPGTIAQVDSLQVDDAYVYWRDAGGAKRMHK